MTALISIRPQTSTFPLGRLVKTPNVLAHVPPNDVIHSLRRHTSCEWGDVDEDDKAANEAALIEGTRLLSIYSSGSEREFWIVTEADRSATTILLPEDY